MSSCSSHYDCYACGCHTCGCGTSSCPYPQWMHPIFACPTHYCYAGSDNGPTLVIHKIVLEPSGSQSCTPRTFSLRITGPSYPCGEVFSLRAGSCTELDEPLVISGLTPGRYTIEEVGSGWGCYDSTLTGPVCGNAVEISAGSVPTVVTIVSRRRLQCRCRHTCHSSCGGWHHADGWHGCHHWNGCASSCFSACRSQNACAGNAGNACNTCSR